MKRVAFYARVSTAKQEQEATIESQVAEIEDKIKSDGNVLVPHLKFIDNGWSGDLLARPSLDKMRDSARKKEFDCLYVYDRGRLARKFAYQEIILEELSELEVEFITLHDVNAVTPEEKVLQSMQGVFHEYERVKIAERMRRGKLGKTRDGKLLGYNPPYGYNYVPKTKNQNGYFIVNENEAEVVKKIFDWVGNDGCTIRRVIFELHKRKLYPRKRKRDFWTKGPLVRLLQNETYTGTHYYYKTESVVPRNPKKVEGKYKRIKKSSRKFRPKEEWIPYKCPQIVAKGLYDKVQVRLKLNRKFDLRNRKYHYLLSGLVQCTCGVTRVGQRGGNHLYYRCADRIYNYPLPARCREGSVGVEVLDNLVWRRVVKLINNGELLKKQAERWLKKKQLSETEGTRFAEEKLVKLGDEEGKYLQAFGTGLISFEVFEKQMKDLKDRKEALQREISEQKVIERQNSVIAGLNVSELCQKALEKINQWDLSKKGQLLRKIIDKVIVNQKLAIIRGFIPVESENLYVAFQPIYRNCRVA